MRPDRRAFLAGLGALAGAAAGRRFPGPLLASQAAQGGAAPSLMFVGSYTSPERGHGEGITVFRAAGAGRWTRAHVVKDLENPSYLMIDADRRCLYAVHGDGDRATAYRVDPGTGRLALLNHAATGGRNGVHLSLDATRRFLIVANYDTGTLAVLPVNEDGSLGALKDLAAMTGTPGPDKTQQTSSHPHDCPFDPAHRFIVVPDKGLDRVFVWSLDTARGTLSPAPAPSVATRSGAGPRHVAFHPTLSCAYVVNELDSSVTTYAYDGSTGALKPLQILPSIPSTFTGDNTAAEIVVARSGRFVYASNRGHDSIAIFAADGRGMLGSAAWVPTEGSTPRFFGFDPAETYLYAANQGSDSVVLFRVNSATGQLTSTGAVLQVGAPSTIVFL